MTVRQAVFLDRDGTLVRDVGYPSDPADMELLPGVIEGLRLLRDNDFALVLVSNQSGIGRGFFSRNDLARVHDRLASELATHGLTFDGVYYCPHAPWEGCECRKPAPGMLSEAALALNLDLSRSFMVGDKVSDCTAGYRAGCKSILIAGQDSPFSPQADNVADMGMPARLIVLPDLLSAAHWIIGSSQLLSGK